MQNQAYYRLKNNFTDVFVDNSYLITNCAGLCVMNNSFINHMPHGRKDYYIQYLISGNLKVFLKEETKEMKPGQLIVYYPNTEYRYGMYDNKELIYYWVHFTGTGADELIRNSNIANRQILDIGIDDELIGLYDDIFKEFIIRDDNFENAVAADILKILVLLNRKIQSNVLNTESLNKNIYQSLDYIHKNFSSKIKISTLAEIEHFSISHYMNMFHKCTGITPIQYITELRLNRACELLSQSDLSIGKISESVGYADQLYFSRIFRRNIGVTPSRYRKSRH